MLKGHKITGSEKLEQSKARLLNSCITKMRTIMIGAIADIEEDFDFDTTRKNILDRGNNLIRTLELEIQQYDISYKGQYLVFRRDEDEG